VKAKPGGDACAMCGKARGARGENPAYPFCSERCRLLDLGNWLGEAYRVPTDEAPDTGGEVIMPGEPAAPEDES